MMKPTLNTQKESKMGMHSRTNAAGGIKYGSPVHEQTSIKTTATTSESKYAEPKAQKGRQDTSQSVKKLFQSFHVESNNTAKLDNKDTSLNSTLLEKSSVTDSPANMLIEVLL